MRMMRVPAVILFLVINGLLHAQILACPDPNQSSLKWGEPPKPWVKSPFSREPQGEKGTRFVKADILVTGDLGQGAVCTYRNSLGKYSIWWQGRVKVPAKKDYNWVDVPSGLICTNSIADCVFTVADPQ